MPKSIPDRWLEYKPYGTVISGTKILPFKVPLKEAVSKNLEPDKRFTPSILLQAFPHLKCIIDLTNTDRYYDQKEFVNSGVKYEKIMVRGREIPTLDVVKKFFKAMDDFTSTCGKDDIVGIHCTHGINRSGYLICRYLTQQLGWEVENSLKAFEEGRGYPIERENYISSLKTISCKKIDTSNIGSEPGVSTSKSFNKMRTLRHKQQQQQKMMGPVDFVSPRRGFAKNGPFSPPRFGFGGPPPSFRPMPPPPGMPPVPPPPIPGPPPMYGPRPFRYGPPPRTAMPPLPPRPGFPIPGFLLPCAPRAPGGTRLPHVPPSRLPHVPPSRLPPPKMPLPPPPPPPHSQSVPRAVALKRLRPQKVKSNVRNGLVVSVRNSAGLIRHNTQTSRTLPKSMKEEDFTVDTFEENLLAPNQPKRRLAKARFNQYK